jgi:hypothetical protein
MIGEMLFAIAVWLALAGFYLLFVGEVSPTELIAAALATSVATGLGMLLHRSRSRKLLLLRAPWPRLVGRPLAALFPDSVRVGGVLLQALWRRPRGAAGMVMRQPFHPGEASALDAGRRGLVTLGLSLAPNGYVLRIPDDRTALLIHRLAPAAPDANQDWPV